MTSALSRRGLTALGVDVSPLAVAMTRSRGASALHRDVFSLSGGPQRWDHVLLVDGNVGIGGDPIRLLWLCRELLAPGGTVLVDLGPPGQGLHITTARLVGSRGTGAWFDWALLGVDALAPGGWFAFSVEPADDAHAVVLQPSLRYAHGEPALRALAARHGFEVRAVETGAIREEQRRPIEGLYWLLQRR